MGLTTILALSFTVCFSLESAAAAVLMPGELHVSSLAIYVLCGLLVGGSAVVVALVWHLRRCHAEISEQRREIALLGSTDQSTGLPNEYGLLQSLEDNQDSARRSGRLVVLAIDCEVRGRAASLNSIAAIEDSLADAVARLRSALALFDPAARIARGDDGCFLGVLGLESGIEPGDLAKTIIQVLARNSEQASSWTGIECVVGVAVSETQDADIPSLLDEARLALREASGSAVSGPSCVYSSGLKAVLFRRHTVEAEIFAALKEGTIEPHFLPKFDLASGGITGVEALARWHNEKLGWISPREFLSAARSMGVMVELDNAILLSACEKACGLPDHVTISVNISAARLFADNFAEVVRKSLRVTGLRPSRLFIEVSEPTLFERPVQVLKVLRDLKAIGVRVALDEFGREGLAALPYLSQFDWDELKIDRNLADQALGDSISHDMVSVVLSYMTRGGVLITGKGIETADQREYLESLGCMAAQGYLFCGPLPASDVEKLFFSLVEQPYARYSA
ncbi:GGDEF domain-containing phosphodiesterase [Roseibium sediminis]|uniref:GGDEF domain-containing phosphodiesterase n=1 Tax=Roseibium sediminis TaxID=1775174 RepID=UPI00123DAC06|nr:GGDEF domain-containing phosphodiesterase [Roseibium sediminis]